uniref:U-box domain-containing protein n=1 Tax=Kalanchoe fedtschenkoi TaxID=63787 RepID=A0A7N0UMR6_KALFE
MTMFKQMKSEVGVNGTVLDLETAVKGGILGGGEAKKPYIIFAAAYGGAGNEKLDLRSMIEELSSIEIPSVFICPISLEPMLDPVTLCTGQTYERSNILKWLSLGHKTCPTTMQELWDESVTPNTTLYQLIYSWFSQKYVVMKKRSEDVHGRVVEILASLKKVKGQARVEALRELREVVAAHNSARKAMSESHGVTGVSALLGPFTTHVVGAEVVGILVHLSIDLESKKDLLQPARISLMVDMLNEGCLETKINCTKLLTTLFEGSDLGSERASSLSLLVGLMRLVKDKRHSSGVFAGLTLLKTISSYESARNSIITIGAVPQLIELLPNLNSKSVELALHVLEVLSNVPEGRLAMKNCSHAIPNLVRLLMRVSENCTQLALSVLGGICELAPDECAAQAVEAGLAPKLLLVIQSGCNPILKQKSAELLKLCSLNYTAALLISKCKLTRTMQ